MRMRTITLMIALFGLLSVHAIPAKKGVKKLVTQSDGKQITVELSGDEFLRFYRTEDGIPVVENERGDYCYATVSNGRLMATSRMATELSQRTAEEIAFVEELNNSTDLIASLKQQRRKARGVQAITAARSRSARVNNYIGERKGLAILVEFADVKFQPGALAHFEAQINQPNYKGNNHYGSVYDYFLDQSNSQLSLKFDVVGPITLTKNAAAYGENDSQGQDVGAGAMVAEACLAVDSVVDFSQYDWGGDQEVEQVYVIYAGYSEAHGGTTTTIWPHMWSLRSSDYGRRLTLDNTRVDVYACSSELKGSTGTIFDGIGTLCHEYSHCFGLPDFYDTSGSSSLAFGLHDWSIMDYGSYGADGDIPCGYTSYEKWFCGWQNPIELNTGTTVTGMKPLNQHGDAYIIYNEGHKDEYYLLENRQKEGWDMSLSGNGLLVLHVDYDSKAWQENTINNDKAHQRVTIIPADNRLSSRSSSLAGDPFPGTSKRTELTNTSTPLASLYNPNSDGAKLMNKPITAITENSAGEISFNFMGGEVITSIEHTDIATSEDLQSRIKALLGHKDTQLYSISGQNLSTSQFDSLPNGVYILRNSEETYKITIKK